MRRNSNDMQVNVAGIRRNLKNFAHNYSDAQKKVREATSNDPWGPSSTIMSEIADLTYNVVAFSEIMQMVWKRLNDHGRNWRHVYKALVLLDYLIKTGSEKVGQQCKENIFAIQTLKDFQHLEEGKDQGQNVREKAKQLVILLKDDEKLKNERARALKAKERFAQTACAFGSDGGLDTPCSPKYPAFRGGEWGSSSGAGSGRSESAAELPREIENARPQTAGEEELQLQLALAMSREEADQEEQKRKSDDVRLQLALSQSQQDFKTIDDHIKHQSHMVDLLDVNLGDAAPVDPWGMPQPPRAQQSSPWASPPSTHHQHSSPADPWNPITQPPKPDPWGTASAVAHSPPPPPPTNIRQQQHDPWSPTSPGSSDLDEFDVITNRNRAASPRTNGTTNGNSHNNGSGGSNNNSNDPFEFSLLGDVLQPQGLSPSTGATKKTPHSFLGENSALVNLDNLVTTTATNKPAAPNPFSDSQAAAANQRPVFNQAPPKPTINEIKQASFAPFVASKTTTNTSIYGDNTFGGVSLNNQQADPWAPAPSNQSSTNQAMSPWMKSGEPANPFLS